MKQKRSTPRHPAPESTARQPGTGTSPAPRSRRRHFCGNCEDNRRLAEVMGEILAAESAKFRNDLEVRAPEANTSAEDTCASPSDPDRGPGLQLPTLKRASVGHLEEPIEDHLDMAAVVIEAFDADDELDLPDTAIAPLDDEGTDAKEGQR